MKRRQAIGFDRAASSACCSALRLGQGQVYRCYQLSQVLRGGFVNDTEQIRPLFVFVAQICEKGSQLHPEYIGQQEQGFHTGGVGAGFEAADGFRVKTGFFRLVQPE